MQWKKEKLLKIVVEVVLMGVVALVLHHVQVLAQALVLVDVKVAVTKVAVVLVVAHVEVIPINIRNLS